MAITFSQLAIVSEMPSKVILELNNITVLEAIKELAKKYNFDEEMIIPKGELHEQLAMLVDGSSIGRLDGLNTILEDGNSVLITGIISGG